MNSRALLLRDKELTKWLISFTHDPRFEQVEVILRAHLAEESASWEQLKGANAALTLLTAITESDLSSTPFPSPGLDTRTTEEIQAEGRAKYAQPKKT